MMAVFLCCVECAEWLRKLYPNCHRMVQQLGDTGQFGGTGQLGGTFYDENVTLRKAS